MEAIEIKGLTMPINAIIIQLHVLTTDRALLFCCWHFWNSSVVRARLVVKIISSN